MPVALLQQELATLEMEAMAAPEAAAFKAAIPSSVLENYVPGVVGDSELVQVHAQSTTALSLPFGFAL